MMNRVVVTGSNGYIGRHVVERLFSKNSCEIVAVDICDQFLSDRIVTKKSDVLSGASDLALFDELCRPDCVVHLAWQDGFNHKSSAHLENLNAHYLFLKNMIDAGCKNINVLGTMHEVGCHEGVVTDSTPCNPLSLYGIAKNALRQSIFAYAENKDVCVKWLRGFYITGDDANSQSVFGKIVKCEAEGKDIFPFTDGKNRYDFIDVRDLAEQIIAASQQVEIDGIINVCSGVPISLKERVEAFIVENNFSIKLEFGAFPSRKYDSREVYGDVSKINTILMR